MSFITRPAWDYYLFCLRTYISTTDTNRTRTEDGTGFRKGRHVLQHASLVGHLVKRWVLVLGSPEDPGLHLTVPRVLRVFFWLGVLVVGSSFDSPAVYIYACIIQHIEKAGAPAGSIPAPASTKAGNNDIPMAEATSQ